MSTATARKRRRLAGLRALDATLSLTASASGGAGGGSGPPEFVDGASSEGSTTVPKPAGVLPGDLLIIIATQNTSSTFATPTGFTAVPGCAVNNAATENNAWYRIADGTEASTFTYTNGVASDGAVCLAYRNVDQDHPIRTSAAQQNGGGAQNVTCPDLIGPGIHVAAATFQSLTSDIAPPAGYTQTEENVGNYKVAAFELEVAEAATGAQTIIGPEWGAGFSIIVAGPSVIG